MTTDPIADYLTRIRNAIQARKRIVEIPSSKMKRALTQILRDKGYVQGYKFEGEGKNAIIKIALKYDPATKLNAITSLERISRPGLRRYAKVEELPRVLNGLGIAIISTSMGVITDKEARENKVGGEVLCYIY